MLVLIGAGVVIASVLGGYLLNGGEIAVLVQPTEWLIIVGAAAGSFVIGNPKKVVAGTAAALKSLLRGSRHDKASYVETLSLLYALFKLAKTKGDLALESHVEKPDESAIFARYPGFNSDYLGCIKACLLAHMMGYAPQVSIEFGRKTLDYDLRPSFVELEQAVGTLVSE